MFNPEYKISNTIVKLLTAIAEAKAVIARARLLPQEELNLRRQAMIRMTHASTSIEGNALHLHQVQAVYHRQKVEASARDIYEVQNYLKAIRLITKSVESRVLLDEKMILKIHKMVTDKTLPPEQCGRYRKGAVYVVRHRLRKPQQILYTAPHWQKVSLLMDNLIQWIEESRKEEIHPIIVAAVVHHEIAAIHPFSDGNGRTARTLATLVLYQRGYDFRRLFALEDYYNEDRPSYYRAIDSGKNYEQRRTDLTPWLEYFVKGFKEEIDAVKAKVVSLSSRKLSKEVQSQIFLTKKQLTMIDFLEQMGRITVGDVMDILHCPKRTAQLALQKMKKLGIISQVGKGPSSAYILA